MPYCECGHPKESHIKEIGFDKACEDCMCPRFRAVKDRYPTFEGT